MLKFSARDGFHSAVRSAGIVSTAALCLLLTSAAAFSDPPEAMAPPVAAQSSQPGTADSDSVFQWTDVPENQQVPLTRAVFDQNGYQLFDTAGETIIVPFANDNLYVMKFAISTTGDMYFVNTGDYPVLYLPQNGYLENASVPGSQWYPFSDSFHPAQPVFLGVAPSWSAFIGMGWYHNMVFYGGYYSPRPFIAGAVFAPTIGLNIVIGGTPYHRWSDYHNYYVAHPAFVPAHPGPFVPAHQFRGAMGGGPGGPGGPGSGPGPGEFHSNGRPGGAAPGQGGSPGGSYEHGGGHVFHGTRSMVHGSNQGHSGGDQGRNGGDQGHNGGDQGHNDH